MKFNLKLFLYTTGQYLNQGRIYEIVVIDVVIILFTHVKRHEHFHLFDWCSSYYSKL